MARDPVCGKEIDEAKARGTTGQTAHGAVEVDPDAGTRMFYKGRWYYFCGMECQYKFTNNPGAYLEEAEQAGS